MSETKSKEITVNPDYLKIVEKKTSKTNVKKRKPPMNAKQIKKELLEQLREKRMKDYQRIVSKKVRDKRNREIKDYLSDGYGSSLDYLNDAIRRHQEKRKKRSLKKTAKIKRLSIGGYVKEKNSNEGIKDYTKDDTKKDTREGIKNNRVNLEGINTINEPPYGCLKGGSKPTYKQYKKTLKRSHFVDNIENEKLTNNLAFSEDIVRLGENKKKPKKKFVNFLKRKKMTIRAGKTKDRKGKLGVFMKNNDIRKRTQKKIDTLKGITIAQMRGYLRERGLIKVGTYAPDDIIRQLYMNSNLAGDITNKNGDVLKHNFFNPESMGHESRETDDSKDNRIEGGEEQTHSVIVS
jgi:hypothetical protein